MVNRIAILCPGPSLAGYLDRSAEHPHDLVIGVNRAACAAECDYWSAVDHEAVGCITPLGKPVLFTSMQALRLATGRYPLMPASRTNPAWTITHEVVAAGTTCPLACGWKQNSMLAAVVLAESLFDGAPASARCIEIFGCDWRGTEDWDGNQIGAAFGRSSDRWKQEMGLFDHTASWLNSRGVRIDRRSGAAA